MKPTGPTSHLNIHNFFVVNNDLWYFLHESYEKYSVEPATDFVSRGEPSDPFMKMPNSRTATQFLEHPQKLQCDASEKNISQ